VDAELPFHFSRHFSPKPFAIFVEGISKLRKYPVCGFVVFYRKESGTEFVDFRFGRHEAVSGKVLSRMPLFCLIVLSENAIGKSRPLRGLTRTRAASPKVRDRASRSRSNRCLQRWRACTATTLASWNVEATKIAHALKVKPSALLEHIP
jgi:hypothetical protein